MLLISPGPSNGTIPYAFSNSECGRFLVSPAGYQDVAVHTVSERQAVLGMESLACELDDAGPDYVK